MSEKLKTVEEWMMQPQIETGAPFICATEDVIRQVQPNAAKWALGVAVEIADNLTKDVRYGSDFRNGSYEVKMRIKSKLSTLTVEASK